MDIHQRRVGFRFNSVRSLLDLSLFEFSRLLNRSHYTLSAIERSIRYPSEDIVLAVIELAQRRKIILTYGWLMDEEQAPIPISTDNSLQKKITEENHIESCLIYCDNPEHRKEFGQRLIILLGNMGFSSLQFARWGQISVGTVQQWISGNSLPKRDAMRFIIRKIEYEGIPLSLEWLCKGNRVLAPFQYIAPPDFNNIQGDGTVIQVKIDSSLFEPHVKRNTKLSAYPYPPNLFVANWSWFYLYCYQEQWLPVQLEGTQQIDTFNIMSLHSKLSDRILLKNVKCDVIYPVIYLEKMYPAKLRRAS